MNIYISIIPSIYIGVDKHTHNEHRQKYIHIYAKRNIYIYHHVVPLARISLTLSRHFSLSFIASGRSSGLHPVSSHSCCMYVLAGRPAFSRPYVGIHRSTSLMSSFLLLRQCPACLARLTWIVFLMVGRWLYSWCFVGCCRGNYSTLLSTLLRNCRLASSPAVLLAPSCASIQQYRHDCYLEETAFYFIGQV